MSNNETEALEVQPSKLKNTLKKLGLFFSFFLLLVFFTLMKFPDQSLGNLILTRAQELSPPGTRLELSAERTRISFLLFGRTRFEQLKIKVIPQNGEPTLIRLDELQISPSLIDLLFLRAGGTLRIKKGGSELITSLWIDRSKNFSTAMTLKDVDLGTNGVNFFGPILGISCKIPMAGTLSLEGSFQDLATLTGTTSLKLLKGELENQRVSGFTIPLTRFNSGEIQIKLDRGKVQVNQFKIGTMDLTKDDLNLSLNGNLTLGHRWPESQVNLSTKILLSESLIKSLMGLETLYSQAKLPDGSYSMQLKGPITFPEVIPGGN